MKKIYSTIILLVVFFVINEANAKIISIENWEGSFNERTSILKKEVLYCHEKCPEYSMHITSCSDDQSLKTCGIEGCEHYKICE